jgi:transposase
MRKTKEVLRLNFELGLGLGEIARSCCLGLGTVHEYLRRAKAAGISWPLPEGWDEEKLESALFGGAPPRAADPAKAAPDFAAIHEQKLRHRHVTLQLLWEEYKQAIRKDTATAVIWRPCFCCARMQDPRRSVLRLPPTATLIDRVPGL